MPYVLVETRYLTSVYLGMVERVSPRTVYTLTILLIGQSVKCEFQTEGVNSTPCLRNRHYFIETFSFPTDMQGFPHTSVDDFTAKGPKRRLVGILPI